MTVNPRNMILSAKAAIRFGVTGAAEINLLREQGTLTPERLLTAAKGAARYIGSLAQGDVASERDQAARSAICKQCPMRTRQTVEGATEPSDWCGPPLQDHTNEAMPILRSCGCLLPAKVAVASEQCPQSKWMPVEPASEGRSG